MLCFDEVMTGFRISKVRLCWGWVGLGLGLGVYTLAPLRMNAIAYCLLLLG